MNNKIFFGGSVLLCFFYAYSHKTLDDTSCFDLACTSGYIWKHDQVFKKIYGQGIPDLITVDGCYYPCCYGGIGLKASYWEKKGCTSCLKQPTRLQEVPLIGYVRARIGTWLQSYISLGGGAIFVREQSYLGCIKTTPGIGEFEWGFNYYPHKNVYLTTAFRYLFPRHTYDGVRAADVGGLGLRAGFGLSF